MGVETQPDVYMLMKDGQVRSLVPLSLDDPDPGGCNYDQNHRIILNIYYKQAWNPGTSFKWYTGVYIFLFDCLAKI